MNLSGRFRLLMLELLCSFSILIICALVCLSFLAKAQQMSDESTDLTRAVYLAQSAAETWKAGGPPPAGQDGYTVTITPLSKEQGVTVCDISVLKGAQVIYTLKEVADYES